MMRAVKIVAIVVGSLLVLVGLALIAPGGFLLGVYGTQRDDSGYFESSSRVVSTSGYALTTPDIDINIGSDVGDWIPTGALGSMRIRGASSGSIPLFIGIGPTDQVSKYLADVARDEVTDFGWLSAAVRYLHFDGGAPPSPPGQQIFWVAKQEGPGIQTLEWDIQDGDWTAVIMNGDASAPVMTTISLGARFGAFLAIAVGLVVAGIVLLAIGIVLIVLGARHSRRRPPTEQPYPSQIPPVSEQPLAQGTPPTQETPPAQGAPPA